MSFRAQARSSKKPKGRPAKATSALVPAGARIDTLDPVEAVLNADAIEMFSLAVGGREQLADTLAVAGAGSEVERVTTLLMDPRYRQWSLARICQTVGITCAELFAYYRKALMARAHIEASHIIAKKLPPVVTDVMDKATPAPIVCPLCTGSRVVNQIEPGQPPVPCPVCRGTGSVLSEPTVERHKLALDLGQLLDKKGGLIVQQNNLAALATTQTGSLEQLQQAVGDLLFGGARASDGTLVPEPDVPSPAPDPDPDLDEDEDDGGGLPDPPPDEAPDEDPTGSLRPHREPTPAEPELPFGEPG